MNKSRNGAQRRRREQSIFYGRSVNPFFTGEERGGHGIEHVVFLFDGVVDVGREFFGISGSSCESVGRS